MPAEQLRVVVGAASDATSARPLQHQQAMADVLPADDDAAVIAALLHELSTFKPAAVVGSDEHFRLASWFRGLLIRLAATWRWGILRDADAQLRSDAELERVFWPLCRAHQDAEHCPYHSTWRLPSAFNPMLALRARPVWNDAPRQPLALFLEEQSDAIRADLDRLLAAERPFRLGTDRELIAAGDWDEIALFNGTEGWSERNCRVAFVTCLLLKRRAEIVGRPTREIEAREAGSPHMITFLRLAPRSRLAWHTGTSNERLTAHLGLRVPRAACPTTCLTIGSDGGHMSRLSWREGQVHVFDDAYFHSAVNNASTPRYILYVTFWHPDLGPFSIPPAPPGAWQP